MNDITRRTLGASTLLGAASLAACASTPPALADNTPITAEELLKRIHPELRPAVKGLIPAMLAAPPLSAETYLNARKPAPSPFVREPAASPAFTERMIPGRNGAPDVRIYVVNAGAAGSTPRPAILHMHGGGYVLRTAHDSVSELQELTRALDCVAVTVEYRLAPETPFPGSLEDNYAGLKWLYDNAESLGVDRSRIAVMGESAGGGHAAMLAIAARDRGEVPLMYQALTYPMLDDRTGSTRSQPNHIGAIVWKPADNRFGWSSLLGVPAGSANVPKGAVPARLENLKGLPPAFIGVGSIDLFVEEDIDYARRLIEAGVATELVVVPGVPHGFDFLQGSKVVKDFRDARVNALRVAFTAPR